MWHCSRLLLSARRAAARAPLLVGASHAPQLSIDISADKPAARRALWIDGTDRQMDIRYDIRCHFNMRSKADISKLNMPHGTDN